MSFLLLRVPKRLALTALRGLVVGTSGTLLVLFEDRRRRIDQARRAVHNGERVRAAKKIRKKSSRPPVDPPKTTTALSSTLKETALADHKKQPSRLQPSSAPKAPPFPPPPVIVNGAPLSSPLPAIANGKTKIADKIRRIKEAAALGDMQSLQAGIITLKSIASNPIYVKEEEQSKLMQAAMDLCRQCQKSGSTSQTEKVLQYVGKIGAVSSTDYHTLDTKTHVERSLADLENLIQRLRSDELSTEESAHKAAWLDAKCAAHKKLDNLLSLVLPDFADDGTILPSRKWEWARLAEKAMRLALDLGGLRIDSSLYNQNLQNAGQEIQDAVKELGHVTKTEAFRRVVRTFVQLQAELSQPDLAIWTTIGNVISDSVQLGSSPGPAASLVYLVQNCPPGLRIRTTWVAKLLWVDWEQFNKKKNAFKSQALFHKFETLGGCEKVTHVDGVYRVMMEIALEAKQWQLADDFLSALKTVAPTAARHPKILGKLAKAKSKLGDWASVWEDFQNMEPRDCIGDVFVPVLDQFSKTHTVEELDQFLRQALQELQVPITPYMVTLVGNRYGELRDVTSFVTWLEFCAGQGVKVDAAFANTILRNCRRHWSFDYQSLKEVYRMLQLLNPTFVDEVTHNMIVTAALTATRHAPAPTIVHNEVSSLAVKFRKEVRLCDPHDLRLWMRRAFGLQNYRMVQNMYEKAVKQGANVDDGHLLLMIRAILQHNANVPMAVRVLNEARQQNILVERATTEVIVFCSRPVFPGKGTDRETVLGNLQSALSQFQAAGLEISSASLLRVAYLCLVNIHHTEAALDYAKSALHLKEAVYPDDVPTFQVFLLAYTWRVDLSGLKWTIRGALQSGILHKKRVLEALKAARRIFEKQGQNAEAQEATRIVDQALDVVRSGRSELAQEQIELRKSTSDIIAKAAKGVANVHQVADDDMQPLIATIEAQEQEDEAERIFNDAKELAGPAGPQERRDAAHLPADHILPSITTNEAQEAF